jgi:4-amino-4-deoxy-L-arabinose transferase-like glycosyltransferase
VKPRVWLSPLLACAAFAFLSLAILPYPGLQDDELLFTVPLYLPQGTLFSVRAFGGRLPLMLNGYLGAFKIWLYAGIFEFFEPSRWSVRAPMVLIGVITIWLTWLWTRRAAGPRAAAFTVALLVTDSVFIVTNTFDWGPVALQHALLMGGLVALQYWIKKDSRRYLFVGFFLLGLGLWDKALMIWPLVGLSVATLCVYPKEMRHHLRRVPLAIAAASLLLGALPLVTYNLIRHGQTASANTKLSLSLIPDKLTELRSTLNGSVLLGPLVATSAGPLEQTPKTLVERASVAIESALGAHPDNWMLPALALSLVCMMFLRSRLLAFILIAMVVTWLQMAANTGTGGAAHHVILLWPFPCVFVGVALAGVADCVPSRASHVVTALVAIVICGNLLNTNEYLADLVLNGAVNGWTDASYRLAGAVFPYRSDQIGIVDWGYIDNLRMMYGGNLKLTAMTDDDRTHISALIAAPDFIFIQHTDDQQIFDGVNDRLRSEARALGYSEEVERVVHDNQARPIFEIFRFVRTP